jgi:hypothetical protein
VVVVTVTTSLLDLGIGLLGSSKITGLERLSQRREGALSGAASLAVLRRSSLGGILLEGGEGRLGTLEVTLLQRLAELVEQVLPLSPLALLGGLGGTDGGNTQVRHNSSMRSE